MSRIGKMPIKIPSGVELEIVNSKPGVMKIDVSGPKGSISKEFKDLLTIQRSEDSVVLTRKDDSKTSKSFHGLYRSLIQNMVDGVVNEYSKTLEIVGIGYRIEMQSNKAVFSLGYSHKINFVPPSGIKITAIDQTTLVVSGIDKQLVGEVAAKIRSFKKPEPYKGKGVRYRGEKVKKKSTKSTK